MNKELAKQQIRKAVQQYDDGEITRASLDLVIEETINEFAPVAPGLVPPPAVQAALDDDFEDDDEELFEVEFEDDDDEEDDLGDWDDDGDWDDEDYDESVN